MMAQPKERATLPWMKERVIQKFPSQTEKVAEELAKLALHIALLAKLAWFANHFCNAVCLAAAAHSPSNLH